MFFFSEMALKEYGMASLCPSLVAASAVYAAQCTLKRSPLWTSTLKHHTGFTESQLRYFFQLSEFPFSLKPELSELPFFLNLKFLNFSMICKLTLVLIVGMN